LIELKDANFSYEGIVALKNINLKIHTGEAIALMGTNGCGKSTLLKLLNGILFPQTGTFSFNGEDITQKRMHDNVFAKAFHKKIGFIFQNPDMQLFCTNVYDEIAFGPRQMGMDEVQVKGRVDECLGLLEIQKLRDRQPYHLSEGEKRKVAMASVLALNPDVLTLDEPLNGLDPRSQRWLVDFLLELGKAGKTIITSTHNIELVHELSTRAVLFDSDHTIVADMPTKDLLDNKELLKQVNLVDTDF
jgi:ABC-type cobalt transport system, ATPase component